MEKERKKYLGGSRIRRGMALTLAAVMASSLAGCGKSGDSGDSAPAKEWAYVPEFVTIDDENVSYYDMQLLGENIYYLSYNWDEATGESSQDICKYSLADKAVSKTPITWEEEGQQNLNRGQFTEDGSMFGLVYAYNEDNSESKQYLTKFGSDGKQAFSTEITELVGDSYVDSIGLDAEGRIYITGDGQILLFDAEGKSQGSVAIDNSGNTWISNMARGRDGKIYVGYSNYDGNKSTYSLCEVDFDGKKLGQPYENVPSNNTFTAGVDYDFLLHNGTAVYGYDLEKQKDEYLFDWLDSDINGNNVRQFSQLEDGRIIAVIEDYENNDSGIALLTKKKAEEVPQKETLTIATMGGSYMLQSEAVKFNKANSQYHISVKDYVDYDNFTENTWSDALANLNNDITSSNCPDMIDLSSMNISQLVAKGILEDLNPYLEKSSKIKREDFLENIMDAYTYDGVLVSIPTNFSVQTVVGSVDTVGTGSGWTLDELMELANSNPDKELFDRVSKQAILGAALMFNEDAFINWETGECNFDSDAFKKILEFVNRFPDEVVWEEGQDSEPTRIQNGEVILAQAYVSDFDDLQMYSDIFKGNFTCIGFPTVDGKRGHSLSANGTYGITTKSAHKDGAWEFLESILTQEDNGRYWGGFPTMKTKLDEMAKKAVEPNYITDENGEIMKDENGEPMVSEGASSVGYKDGWSYTYHQTTQEEVDQVLALMKEARPVNYNGNDEITNIINEEAEGFFKGQKSVDEVAGIIQNRINIYVSETK